METVIIFAGLLVVFTATSPAVNGKYYSKSQILNAPTTVKKTHLNFFMHDTLGGSHPFSVLVAKPNRTVGGLGNAIIPFGAFYAFDDPLTVGPDPHSEVIGNARGTYTSISRGSDLTVMFNGDFEFTSGKFNGSSISVFSRDQFLTEKELTVVGGKGEFRMAKGFIIRNDIFVNATDALVQCLVTIFH